MALYISAALGTLLILVVDLVLESLCIYAAARIVAGERATFGRSVVAAIVAPAVLLFLLGALGLASAVVPFFVIVLPIALIVLIVVLSWVYAEIFRTGLVGGFVIGLLATVFTFLTVFIVSAFLVSVPYVHIPVVHPRPMGDIMYTILSF
ncbi:hypothetical protein GCM10007108_15510 [Thermogymnomonas acidicola]|uniref:Uncharacterized protein n=1 Tax=Thermogymnomonas acidicola TaxID=399579 RepID=A0AA37BSH1_9ARCH|nr:hypothetical protein [Thermogymnomonas acidicola]GGM78257.1 hypothetical protein GCM10007108_15510 [Thermogymnomonas acidicola]